AYYCSAWDNSLSTWLF
nr:immunoglobulin light chain junction region [Macaca mulatta]